MMKIFFFVTSLIYTNEYLELGQLQVVSFVQPTVQSINDHWWTTHLKLKNTL